MKSRVSQERPINPREVNLTLNLQILAVIFSIHFSVISQDLESKREISTKSKKDIEVNQTSGQQLVLLETSDLKAPKVKPLFQHQMSLELFASSYWKNAPSLEAVETQPKTPQPHEIQPQYVAEEGMEQESNPKYTNTVSLYPDSPNFPGYVESESFDAKGPKVTNNNEIISEVRGSLDRRASGKGRRPSQVLGEYLQVAEPRIEGSQHTGKFGLESSAGAKQPGVQLSGGTGDLQQSSSIQNVTFMQGPLAESGGSHGQPAMSTFSFKLKPAD